MRYMKSPGRNNPMNWVTWIWALLPWLCLLNPGCQDQGLFDRYDACERWVSLCEPWRGALAPCVEWMEANSPDDVYQALQVGCVMDASTCQEIAEVCALDP